MKAQGSLKLSVGIRFVCLLCCASLLTACGGGNQQGSDPTVVELPIAYVKRPVPTDNGMPDGNPISIDLRDPETIRPGAHLIVKKTASVNSPEIDVTNAIIGDTGDVRDPSFSPDGTKLLFALHMAEDNNANPPITWDIYEYDLNKPLSQASGSENPYRVLQFGASDGDDIQPSYMPGNRILFVSTRATKTKAIQRDQGFSGGFSPTVEDPKSNLHTFNIFSMDDTGAFSSIKQLSFNMSDDFSPSIIRNMPGLEGRILFSRWEHSPGKNQMSIYTMRQDGTDVQILYGENSHNTGSGNSTIQFVQPRETSAGQIIALAMPFTDTFDGGDPVLINANQYVDNTVPVDTTSGLGGPGQISLSDNTVTTVPGLSLGGRFSSVFPMLDGTNRAIVSYSLCYLSVVNTATTTRELKSCNDQSARNDPTALEAPPAYGLFVFDIGGRSMLPILPPEQGIYYTDVAAAMNIGDAPYQVSTTTAESTGTLDIRSVYDMDGSFSKLGSTDTSLTSLDQLADPAQSTADKANNPGLIERPAMFLRIVKGVYMPDSTLNNFGISAFGVSRRRMMREIIGYAPIDPDGSVKVQVPANVPLSFDVLDRNGRRIRFSQNNQNINMEHGIWLSVRPGETLTCGGCHNPNARNIPHGRRAAQPNSLNTGASAAEVAPNSFTNTSIQPSQAGQTMAEARTDRGGPLSLRPSVDIIFNDVWTDMTTTANQAARTAVDSAFFYEYEYLPVWAPLTQKVAPVADACRIPSGSWSSNCRTVINYETNIDPMWAYTTRYVTDSLGNQVLVGGNPVDKTCTSCHNSTDQASNGYLDLSSNAVSLNANWFGAYSQLLQAHDEIAADGSNVTEPGVDANGNPILVNVQTTPSIVPGSAAQSTFFREFTNDPAVTTPHCTVDTNGICQPWLNVHELKLMSEWVDIGAQYYNNSFVAP